MSNWIVDEKGSPENGDWEISVVLSTNLHGIRSYGWDDEEKIIIWSFGGPCELTCDEFLSRQIKDVAQKYCDMKNMEKKS